MNSKKFIEPPRHALDFKFHKRVHKKLNALLNARIVDENGNVIGTVDYGDGGTLFRFTASAGGGLYIAGEYDPTQSYPDKSKGTQAIVFFTPDGGAAGVYYTLPGVTVPAGVTPDTGAPNWATFPNASPGMFL